MADKAPDLNALAAFLKAGNAQNRPAAPPPVVDREGKVHTDGKVADDRSQIPKGVFAGLAQETREIELYFPKNAEQLTFSGFAGWVYAFENDLTDHYRMWAYFDPRSTLYKVKMVDPPVEENVDPHVSHYFRNGDLCLTKDIGTRTLQDAYARSVAFSIGWSVWKRYKSFPFNPD
jgi:hypothetical protein